MLPNISLDVDKYEDIIYDARNMIVSLYPEWTDFNYHDPGITILELFSWIKESQQYYMDQIGDENRKKYLKLLGLQRHTKLPARAEAEVITQQDIDVLKGTKFYAGEICFEAEERRYILKDDLCRCISYEGELARIINRRQLDFGNKLKILPFGREPRVDNCFYLGFDEALPKNTNLRALIDIYDDYEVRRMPITNPKSFYPLAEIILEVKTNRGWQEAALLSDETYALLCSGNINFSVDFDMEPCIIEGLEGYYLRLRLARCDYDVPPVVQAIRFNSIALRQRDTQSEVIDFPLSDDGKYYAATELSVSGVSQLFVKINQTYHLVPTVTKNIDYENNCAAFEIEMNPEHLGAEGLRLVNTTGMFANSNIAGFGTGLPFQELNLNHENIEYSSFEIMTEDTDVPDRYLPWIKVNDFSASTPEDRHYVLDSATGVVKFGDCINGLAPEGTILIIGYVHTLGAGGNVKQNTINRIGQEDIPGIQVNNRESSAGGENEETLDACFRRAQRMLKSPLSAVTYSDYESCVLNTPGLMIQSCKAIPAKLTRRHDNIPDMTLNIVVKPFRPEQAEYISDVYIRNIQNHLDNFRLLGTNIELIAPEYIGVTIYADVIVKPHYLNAQALVEEAVKNFFFRYKDQFGAEVVYSELYGVIDRLECVSFVNTLSVEAKGNGISRTKEGNITLQANGVIVLSGTQYMFSVDQD
jgi:Baseplate J-like protein.